MNDAPVLIADGVRKRYRDGEIEREALHAADLTMPAGTLWALAGPSGSGKTTLLAVLGGMLTPTEGDVRLLGKSLVHMRDHHRARYRRRHVGFVFQDLGLIEGMSLLDNVLLPLVPLGGGEREDVERARGLLERFGLGTRADSDVRRLSGGERQRGAIARALVLDPALLLLDEPTAHVDQENALAIIDALAGLRDQGRAILAATHDPRLVEHASVDRVVTMRDGNLTVGSG